MTEFKESTSVLEIIDKAYELRSALEHRIVVKYISIFFPNSEQKFLKLISFFLQKLEGPLLLSTKEFTNQSFILEYCKIGENPEKNAKQYITKDKKFVIENKMYAIVLDYGHYLNCHTLGESSVEEEIEFLSSSEFLCSIPKKKLYTLFKRAAILKYSISQSVFTEGQRIETGESGSGVFMIRKGEFAYFKSSKKEDKLIEVLQFSNGHLFGMLELTGQAAKMYSPSSRQLTVKCKTHVGIVYKFSEELFLTHIKPYCETIINSKQDKILRYINGQYEKNKKIREEITPYLSQTLKRGNSENDASNMKSVDFPLLHRKKLSVPNADELGLQSTLSQQIEQNGLTRNRYFSLTRDGPIKSFPMAGQRAKFVESEFKELSRLERNKEMFTKLKELTLKGKNPAPRSEILFQFFKHTWNFDRELHQRHMSKRN